MYVRQSRGDQSSGKNRIQISKTNSGFFRLSVQRSQTGTACELLQSWLTGATLFICKTKARLSIWRSNGPFLSYQQIPIKNEDGEYELNIYNSMWNDHVNFFDFWIKFIRVLISSVRCGSFCALKNYTYQRKGRQNSEWFVAWYVVNKYFRLCLIM